MPGAISGNGANDRTPLTMRSFGGMSNELAKKCRRLQSPPDVTIETETGPVVGEPQAACLVRIYPMGPGMGVRYTFDQLPLVIGRSEECQIVAQESAVSRRHAQIDRGP